MLMWLLLFVNAVFDGMPLLVMNLLMFLEKLCVKGLKCASDIFAYLTEDVASDILGHVNGIEHGTKVAPSAIFDPCHANLLPTKLSVIQIFPIQRYSD